MQTLSNYDYLYAIFMFAFGLFMIFSPRTLMRGSKYDEDSLKTEKWVKRLGIGLCVIGVIFGIWIYMSMKNA
jgi:hypothetical protein